MKEKLFKFLIDKILSQLDDKTIIGFIDSFLDAVEGHAKATDTKMDDIAVGALCQRLREALHVE